MEMKISVKPVATVWLEGPHYYVWTTKGHSDAGMGRSRFLNTHPVIRIDRELPIHVQEQ